MSSYICAIVLIVVLVGPASSRLDSFKTVNDYMDICMDGMNHKTVPGPEAELMAHVCSPWANRSCCTPKTAEAIGTLPRWLNFDWDHCKQLSPQCREYFIEDLCFYECSPNVGPWLVVDERKIRNERFLNVPLCQTACNNWWEACKDELTCVANWAKEFSWSTGINTCPPDSTCRPFHEVYNDSSNFCETLMGYSFKVVPDTEDCFVTWFDPKLGNPNEKVARKKASSILGVPYEAKADESIKSKNHGNGSETITSLSVFCFVVCFILHNVIAYLGL